MKIETLVRVAKYNDGFASLVNSDGIEIEGLNELTHQQVDQIAQALNTQAEAVRLLRENCTEEYGRYCCCEVRIGNPNMRGKHSQYCNNVNTLLKEYQ